MERRRGAQGSGVQPRSGARDLGTNRAAEPGPGKEPRRGARGSRVGPRSGASGSERSRTTESRESGRSRAAEPRDRGWRRTAESRGSERCSAAKPRDRGWSRTAESRWSRMQPRRGAPRSGRSRAAEPRGREWSQQLRLGQEQLKHVSPGSAPPPPPPGRRGLLCVYNLPPGKSAVLQGPGDGGTRRVSVAQVGAGGCAFRGGSGSLLPGKADWSQTALLQGSHFPGAGWTLGGFQPHFLPRPSPLFSQRHLPNSRHYYYTQGTPVLAQRAGKKPGGATEEQRGRGKGKRRGRRRHAARSFAKPHGHHPHPPSAIQPPRVPQQVHPRTHRWTSR